MLKRTNVESGDIALAAHIHNDARIEKERVHGSTFAKLFFESLLGFLS
jgi:hypothetical protein